MGRTHGSHRISRSGDARRHDLRAARECDHIHAPVPRIDGGGGDSVAVVEQDRGDESGQRRDADDRRAGREPDSARRGDADPYAGE